MIAVIDLGGHQALVQKGDTLQIDKIDVEPGKKTSFPVLMVSEPDGKNFQLGAPALDGVTVEAKVVSQVKDEKLTVFKMKPRKRYRRTIGHRAQKTEIEILDIKGISTKTEPKAAAKKAASPDASPAKKPAAKKPATKKAA